MQPFVEILLSPSVLLPISAICIATCLWLISGSVWSKSLIFSTVITWIFGWILKFDITVLHQLAYIAFFYFLFSIFTFMLFKLKKQADVLYEQTMPGYNHD